MDTTRKICRYFCSRNLQDFPANPHFLQIYGTSTSQGNAGKKEKAFPFGFQGYYFTLFIYDDIKAKSIFWENLGRCSFYLLYQIFHDKMSVSK